MKTLWLIIAFAGALLANQVTSQPVAQPEDMTITNLQIVDGNNRSLGTAHFTSGTFFNESSVVMNIDDHFVLIHIAPNGFRDTRANVAFESTDCSGTPYLISAEQYFLLSPAAVTVPGNTLWVPTGEEPRGIFRASILIPPDEARPHGCYATGTHVEVGTPARAALQLDALFVPPFRLRSVTHIHRQTKRTFSGPALTR